MRVGIYASALPGLGPKMVGERAWAAWNSVRSDDVDLHLVSGGIPVDHVGTGLDDVVLATSPEVNAHQIDDAPRRIWWVDATTGEAWCDLAESLTWSADMDPRGSTAFLGRDIRELTRRGVTRINVHVPRLMRHSDAGIGMLFALADMDEPQDVPSVEVISEALARARNGMGALGIVVTYPSEVALTGVNGMARAWAQDGFDASVAQEGERLFGRIGTRLNSSSGTGAHRSLLAETIDPASAPFAGVGGGLGAMVSLLGGHARILGDTLPLGQPADVDLNVYICDAIGMDLPSALTVLARQSEEGGVPVVVITDSSGLRKGELPKLGLHGAYEVRPERAFLDEVNSMADLADLPVRLDDAVARVAQTWGWDG